MSVSAKELIDEIDVYLNNPARCQQAILDFTRRATNGEYLYVDPTNPVVNAIEASVLTSAATVTSYESFLRKQYPVLAQTWDDLFRHMSDMDYLNRFSVPNRTTFTIMFRKSEILNKMVVDPATGFKKLVIPRNTFFTVSETEFCLSYPIEIRQLTHGELQVVYNTDKPSPIAELSSNQIEITERQDSNNNRFISFDVDVTQLHVDTRVLDMNASVKFSTTFTISDQFYYARVFIKDDNGQWEEIRTTHSDLVYDPTVMTSTIRVEDKTITVGIPEIYTVNANNSRQVRIDVYETKGPLVMLLSNYPASGFSVTWYAIDETEIDQYVAPLTTLETQIVFSTKTVAGGKNGLTFEELRERLISNAIGNPFIPVSNVQIESALEDENYEIVKNIDVITNRVYLATRDLPEPTNDQLITSASASIQTGLFSMSEAVMIDTVIDNGNSVTITPDTIFENRNNRAYLVPSDVVNYIQTLSPDQRAVYVNNKNYYYTPFHYVLDATGSEFDVRPYYLDSPVIDSKTFVDQNDTTLLYVTIDGYKITKSNEGYLIDIVLQSSQEFTDLDDNEVFVQIRFKSQRETDFAYQNGILLGNTSDGRRVYRFDLSTNFNVNSDNGLELTKFLMYTPDPKVITATLFQEFEVIFGTSRAMDTQYVPNDVDDALGRFILPPDVVGISIEKLRVRFGYYLERLWVRARTVVSEAAYSRYTVDIFDYYTENVYEVNPDTGGTIFIENGQPVQHLLHSAGEQKMNNGQPVILHHAGDPIEDEHGNPIIDNPRKLYRQVDYMLIEGSYWFATDSVALSYRQEMTDIFVDWIVNSLTDIQQKLIEQTRIYFYPKNTTGTIDVMVKNGVTTSISASQEFLLILHVNENTYSNVPLRNQLKVKAIEVISEELRKSVISVSQITKKLTEAFNDDVIDVEISGLGGTNNYSTVTVLHETDRPSIRKLLKAQADGSLIVEEAVELTFVRHSMNK